MLLHLVVVEREIEDVEIVGDALRLRRKRNGGDVLLQQPAQRDLRDAAAALFGDVVQQRIAEQAAARQRTIGDEDEPVPAHRGEELRLVEIGMILRLQGDQRFGTERDRLVEQRDVEIGDADVAGKPGPLGLGQRRHGLLQRDLPDWASAPAAGRRNRP